jgi:hypothetical protein
MNTTIIVAVIAVLICICFIILGGVAFNMNQAKLKKSTESTESPESESESPESESDETSSTVNVKIGEAIGCRTGNPKDNLRALYRYVGDKKIRYYPNVEILNSWGSTAGDGPIRAIDCTGFTLGADMEKKI